MKNWTVKDAVIAIMKGADIADVKEITTHFPEFALAVARKDLVAVAAMMPEKMTLSRLQLDATEAENNDEEEMEAPEASSKAKEEPSDDEDYSNMTKDQLIELCDKKGIKVARHQKPKQYYIDALNAAGDDGGEASKKKGKVIPMDKKAKAEDDDEDSEYAGKTAKELFDMCKERGIKVQKRQPSNIYIEALKAADAEAEDDGWGDDESVQEKVSKKPNEKAAPKEEDDGDDWEI